MFERESFEIQAKIRRGFEVERENENITKTVENVRTKERELTKQVEELRGQLRQKEQEIERLQSRNENVNYWQKSTEQELAQAREEIQKLTEIINNTKNDELKQEQRKNVQELELLDLRKSLTALRDEH